MVLRQLQNLLAGLYDVEVALDVYDFLVTDRAALPACARAAPADEQLIIAQLEGDIRVSLFLDAGVHERLTRANPVTTLNETNLADYLTALEGVSHFVYLAWNAAHDKCVSLLELEMQAEVDKYVSALCLLRTQRPERFPRELHRVLFERARVDPQLAGERFELYRAANDYAARFCRQLGDVAQDSTGSLDAATLAELRRFYRLTNARKVEHIQRRR
jgi:hypothetical protein